ARDGLSKPARALDGETQLDRADSEAGARQVENLIGRLVHGVYTSCRGCGAWSSAITRPRRSTARLRSGSAGAGIHLVSEPSIPAQPRRSPSSRSSFTSTSGAGFLAW